MLPFCLFVRLFILLIKHFILRQMILICWTRVCLTACLPECPYRLSLMSACVSAAFNLRAHVDCKNASFATEIIK